MRARGCCFGVTLAFWAVSVSWSLCAAQSPSAADWFPSTTVLYVEAADAQRFVDLPLGQQLVANPLFQELWRSPEAMKFRGGITLAEVALGQRVPATLRDATAHGAALAVDIETQGVALLAHARDADTCERLVSKLAGLAQSQDKNAEGGGAIKKIEYRGKVAYEGNQIVITSLGDHLLASNKGELAKKIVDNYLDSSAGGLASVAAFSASRQPAADDASTRLFWAWSNLAELRDRGVAGDLFKRPDENFVAELVLGGLLAAIRDASTASAELTSDADRLRLSVNIREAGAVQQPEYEFFFGKDGQGTAPAPMHLENGLFTLAAHRDVAELWRRAGDLFGQRTNDQLAVADATLTTLFSGKDFGEEILGAIEPGVQIVAAAQDFSALDLPQPSIQLPAFALVTKLRQPEEMQPQLKRIFMSLVGFINITGAMDQQPQLDIEVAQEENATYVLATYAADADRPEEWAVPIQFNFSPTLALVGDHAILASTGTIARDIVRNLSSGAGASEPARAASESAGPLRLNTVLHLHGAAITEALANNRDQLISQNILEEGHTQEEAASEIDMLLQLSGVVHALKVQLGVGTDVEINAELQLKPAGTAKQ